MTIMMQAGITFFYLNDTIIEKDLQFNLGSNVLNMCRLIATLMMHLKLYPEIKISMEMVQYSIFNSKEFLKESCFFPILIALCQLCGALLIELGSIYLMLTYTSIKTVIGGYVKLTVLGDAPKLMALTLEGVDMSLDQTFKMRKNVKFYDDWKLIQQWWNDEKMFVLKKIAMSAMLLFNRGLKFLYVTVYFYFTPILVFYLAEFYYEQDRARFT